MEKLLYMYSHGQELFYKFVSEITNKLVKQLLSMTVFICFDSVSCLDNSLFYINLDLKLHKVLIFVLLKSTNQVLFLH